MKKYFIIFTAMTIMFNPFIYSNQNECQYLFRKLYISPNIKSRDGWTRVIKNNKLNEYIDTSSLSDNDTITLKECLLLNSFNVNTYDRGIGK